MEWDEFLPHVLPDAKGCPDPVAIDAVIRAAREFCEETRVWSFECDPITTGAGVKEYVLQLGEGQDLVRLLDVSVGGCPYSIKRGAHARAAIRAGVAREMAYMNGPLSFNLYPVPGADGVAIVADVTVKPSLNAAEWPDDLAEYVEDIAVGALAVLLEQEGEDWSSERRAAIKRERFKARMAAVKGDVERGYGRSARPSVSGWF